MAEHQRFDFLSADGPFETGSLLPAETRFHFVAPKPDPGLRAALRGPGGTLAPPRVVLPRLGIARVSTGLATSLGLLALLTAIGIGGLLSSDRGAPAPAAAPQAPEVAVLPPPPGAPALPADSAGVSPALRPEQRPSLSAPAGLGRPEAARPPQVAADTPPPFGPTLRAVAASPRPPLRPGLPAAPAAEPEAEPVPETLVAGLASSLRPVPRPAEILARIAPPVSPEGEEVVPVRLAEPEVVAAVAPRVQIDPVRPSAAAACPSRLSSGMSRRPGGAASGSDLAARLGPLAGSERDRLLTAELLGGNIPDFLRRLTPVSLSGKRSDGLPVTVTFCVTPDYLAVGSDRDFFRVPLGLPAAAMVADKMGFLLPTTRMVDAIYEQAGVRLAPQPMTPGAAMTTTQYFWAHNQKVAGQLGGRADGALTAGQKKDIVLSNLLRSRPGKIAIYGWHRPNGQPIQPLSTVHGAYYADYSHGVRLVSRTAFVNGKAVPLADILSDPAYAGILSKEGPIQAPERLMAALYR